MTNNLLLFGIEIFCILRLFIRGRAAMAVIEPRKTKDGKTHYRVKIRLKGYPIQTSTHERLTDAKRWAQQTETALREGRHFKATESKKHTLGDLIDLYIRDYLPQKQKSEKKQNAQLTWWKEQLGQYSLAEVTPALIVEKKNILAKGITYRGTQRSPSTVVRYMAALSHVFTIAIRELGWMDDNPMRKISKPKEARGRVRFLEQDELDRLLQVCKESNNPILYPIVLLALLTGMRYGEIINLTWQDIDFDNKRIILHETKNGERRAIPLSDTALELLNGLEGEKHSASSLLFPKMSSRQGSKTNTKSSITLQKNEIERIQKVQRPAQIRSAWEIALKKADITNFRFHDLRHCAASYLLMSGASLAELAEILGHKTLAMVKRYAHLSDSHKHAVVDRMNKKFLGGKK